MHVPKMQALLVALLLAAAAFAHSSPESSGNAAAPPRCGLEEEAALLDFKSSIGGGAAALDSWSAAISCCRWRGVTCSNASKDDDDSRRFTAASIGLKVVSIVVSEANLDGVISPAIAALQALEVLDLSGNTIGGEIPRRISSLARLRILDLSFNNITGVLLDSAFPSSIEVLNLTGNMFYGPLPSLATSPRLQAVDLSNNYFRESIPADFVCARFINISVNDLTGPPLGSLPDRCGDSVEFFIASHNIPDGPIPSSVGKMSSLRMLRLTHCNVSGGIPDEIGNLTRLEELNLENNNIGGELPSSITNCSSLKVLVSRHNRLQGAISHLNFAKLLQLSVLDLSFNMLTGILPASISGCSNLTSLALGKNLFTGEIPDSLGRLQQLETLSLSGNELTGGLPPALQECSSLVSLILSKNSFTKPLPSNLTGFKSLQLLAIGNANLPGSIPAWLASCGNLQVLDMSWNKLEGEIPRWFGAMPHLFYIDLSNNSFSGELPRELSNVTCLREDDHSGLKQPASSTLFVKHNSNASALAYNQVSAFPPSLILAHNHLTGSIPWEMGQLKKLVALDLSNNMLNGSIPSSLASAIALEVLDLSCNKLSGVIPRLLANLTFLAAFNVSDNQLEGPVPVANQFSLFSLASYLGNRGLCGATISVQCPPAEPASAFNSTGPVPSRRMPRGALMGVAISISLGLTALFAAMLMLSFSRRNRGFHSRDGHNELEENFKELSLAQMMNLTVTMFQRYQDQQQQPQPQQDYHQLSLMKHQYNHLQRQQRITVGDLIKATNNFDASNIIGCGGFGLVFKAHLPPNGKVVAIKRLIGEEGGPQMEKEFDAELMTLGKVSHENLVPLEGYCRLGSRERLLVYAYMENGSLDYWLHERADGGLRLSWKRRLDILRGAARGLEYLHCSCDPHIVHRDIKSSNILLDSGFRAHVADFGLARLMLPSDTHVTTELVGTLGYIPPEYAQSSVATLRGDVYSFGVLILEVLSRRRPVDVGPVARRRGARDLVPWVRAMCAAGRGGEILDPLLLTEDDHPAAAREMLRVLATACSCVDACPQRRPGIEDVVLWLHNA